MNDFKTELQRIRDELRSLVEDLGAAPFPEDNTWDELVPATHSLRQDIRVTRFDLATEFLAVICERDQLLKRIGEHCGLDFRDQVRYDKVDSMANRLFEDKTLVNRIGDHINKEAARRFGSGLIDYKCEHAQMEVETEEFDTLADFLLHESVEAERDQLLVERLAGREGIDPNLKGLVFTGAGKLQKSIMGELSPDDFKTLSRWLKAYRHATLNYTWLSPSDNRETPIQHLQNLLTNHRSYPFGWLRQLSNSPEYAGFGDDLYGIWEMLAGLFSQIDFDDLVDGLSNSFPAFGAGGDDRINIVPGDDKVACKPVLLALARGAGKTGKFAFENVMKAVKQHLIDCQDVLKLVVVVTDPWDSRKFMEDHYGELSAWRRRNIRFLFLGVGAPRDQIAPIAVDLT